MEVVRSADSIRAQTDRVLGSAHFARSGALSRLLRFVVNQALDGKDQELKEYRLGVDVFERGPDFDPRVDPIVRMQAAKLRARLAEYYASDGRTDPIVISMPKGGYAPAFENARQTATPADAPPAADIQSIAVLPFVSMSSDPENEYFADGLTEELINVLTYVPGLRVVARTSAFAFKNTNKDVREIGAQLKVRTVLEGSVRRSGNQLRVTAQLIDVATGYHLLSRTFPREMKDVFAVQEELAGAVLTEILPQVRGESEFVARNYTEDLDAYGSYLKATFTVSNRFTGPKEAVPVFREVLAKDPTYAPAWAGIANAYCMQAWLGMMPCKEALSGVRENAGKAIELDSGIGLAHATLGVAQAMLEWDWQGAEQSFRKAIAVQPSLASAYQYFAFTCLMPQRRFEEAISVTERALVLNPFDMTLNTAAILTFASTGKLEAAFQRSRVSMEINPNHPFSPGAFAFACEIADRQDEALSGYRRACELTGGAAFPVAGLGHVLGKRADAAGARQALDQLLRSPAADGVLSGLIHLSLGDHAEAMRHIELGAEARQPHTLLLAYDPRFAPLYQDARFQRLLSSMGLRRAATA